MDVCPFVVPLIPLFRTSGDVCPVVKAMVDFSLVRFLACMLFLRFTSGVTPANLLMASMVAGHIPYMCLAEVGCQVSGQSQHIESASSGFVSN